MTDEIDRKIAELTEAQQVAMIEAECLSDSRTLVDSAPVHGSGPWPQGLCRYYSQKLDALTPLGLSIRARLQERQP
jgi:hypothetical protein